MSYTHLSRDDRIMLDALLREGLSLRSCARNIGASPTTISNEVRINGGRDSYKPRMAHRRRLLARSEANQCHRKIGRELALTNKILELLALDWSPEQIAGRMMLEWGFALSSPTSIYNYVNPRKELHHLLPRKCNRYRRTKAGNLRKAFREGLSLKKSIDTRPASVETREELGHWEGDTIVGKERTARILTHVERKSGFLMAELMKTVTSAKVSETTVKSFKRVPRSKKLTATYDNGTENGDFEATEQGTGMSVYFAHAYHSWERGTNENTNGLIRRYFPKGTYFSSISESKLKIVVAKINHRPRKRLGYKTPYEVFHSVTVRTLI